MGECFGGCDYVEGDRGLFRQRLGTLKEEEEKKEERCEAEQDGHREARTTLGQRSICARDVLRRSVGVS